MKRKAAQAQVEKKVERVETDEDEALGDDLELDKSGSEADDDDSDSSVYSDLEGEDDSEEDEEDEEDESSSEDDDDDGEEEDKAGPGGKRDGKSAAKADEYEYDSSDEEDIRNTIGNVPVNWYDEYGHIGYDVDGAPIRKPKRGDELDQFLSR